MPKIKVILISSVHPEPTSAGQITLYRHLIGHSEIEVEVYGDEPVKLTPSTMLRRLFGRLGRTGFRRFAQDFWAVWEGRWLDSFLPGEVSQDGRTVVFTVAHGDACMAALRFANRNQLPFVTIFHDWWPDIPNVHSYFRKRLEQNFRLLYESSKTALCVCEGMKNALGDNPNAQVMYPIPARPNSRSNGALGTKSASESFKVVYFGNLSEYGPMLADVLLELKDHRTVRLEVQGADPNWPEDFQKEMREKGLWRDFAPRNQLDGWLAEANAFLVVMGFEPKLKRRLENPW
jgi:hypothetical protein